MKRTRPMLRGGEGEGDMRDVGLRGGLVVMMSVDKGRAASRARLKHMEQNGDRQTHGTKW